MEAEMLRVKPERRSTRERTVTLLAAAERGAIVALANKETLVCAGGLFMRRAAAAGATVLPVDSEHNALFQSMAGSRPEDVRRVILTASGGPFRTASVQAMRAATV